MRERDIDSVVENKYKSALKSIRIVNWLFRWFGFVLNPLFDKYAKPVLRITYGYCANCIYRHQCGADVLFAGGITPSNILKAMEKNGVEHLHSNWEEVFLALEEVYSGCLKLKQGGTKWNREYFKNY